MLRTIVFCIARFILFFLFSFFSVCLIFFFCLFFLFRLLCLFVMFCLFLFYCCYICFCFVCFVCFICFVLFVFVLFFLVFFYLFYLFYLLLFYLFILHNKRPVSADGTPGQSPAGGGSGGSVIINAQQVAGDGSVTAVLFVYDYIILFRNIINLFLLPTEWCRSGPQRV
jgi:hypothetical protein